MSEGQVGRKCQYAGVVELVVAARSPPNWARMSLCVSSPVKSSSRAARAARRRARARQMPIEGVPFQGSRPDDPHPQALSSGEYNRAIEVRCGCCDVGVREISCECNGVANRGEAQDTRFLRPLSLRIRSTCERRTQHRLVTNIVTNREIYRSRFYPQGGRHRSTGRSMKPPRGANHASRQRDHFNTPSRAC